MLKISKYIKLTTLFTTLLLVGCGPTTSSNDSYSSEPQSEQSSESSSDISSGNGSSASSEGSNSSSESNSESSDGSSSEFIPPVEENWIDDEFDRSYAYDQTGYDIPYYVPTNNPYTHIRSDYDKELFYQTDYNRASSYEDAMYRTEAGLVSGDIKDTGSFESYPINHLPNRAYRKLSSYRINQGTYENHTDGSFKSYTINNLEGKVKRIYYGAAYVTLEDVAAYLFAFGRGPANYMTSKSPSAINRAIDDWGQYGRVNDDYYSSDVTEYKYEPSLPNTDNGGPVLSGMYHYHELDFGYTQTPWGYGVASNQPYNNGSQINRGTVRFVYTAKTLDEKWGAEYIPVEKRHVFLTFNHYNDFVEYLNYEGGWGKPFGWMSAGNDYCAGKTGNKYGPGYSDFIDPYPQTTYPVPAIKSLAELKGIYQQTLN